MPHPAIVHGILNCSASFEVPLTDGQVHDLGSFVEDCLLDWMGPGGDLAFFEMYFLANNCFPSVFIYFAPGGEVDADSQRRIDLGTLFVDYCESHGLDRSSFGLTEDRSGCIFLPQNDEIIGRVAKRMEGDERLAFLVTQREVATVAAPGWLLIAIPEVNYRSDLMGELAKPWDLLPPPYGPYVPLRRP